MKPVRSIVAAGFATLFILLTFAGCDRAGEDNSTLGTHTLTIVDTSGNKPMGGSVGTFHDDVTGVTTHTFESANGRYHIKLIDDVLTINGDQYLLKNPTDTIRIVDERIEINGVESRPEVP
ncbi:MAG: hypothetical protein KDN19_13320 [Verrucomicrobiae bacterium]|nr:hypothetical protein [Verrucomicrobiae bacterium]